MQEEGAAIDIQEAVIFCDKLRFNLFNAVAFARKYVPGEIPGVIFPVGTIITVYRLFNFDARVFPVILREVTKEDREAHFAVSDAAGVVIWQDYKQKERHSLMSLTFFEHPVGHGRTTTKNIEAIIK